ncbi:MAG: DUF2306 domain-containing protein [Amphiplicatus sp.]
MSLEPLLAAPWFIQAHAFCAIAAFFLGVVQLTAPKGTLPHRTLGVIWVVLMIVVTITSAFIVHPTNPGDPFWARFSFIHIFTVITAIGLVGGIRYLLAGGPNLKKHRGPFIGMFIGGLIIAGALAFLPGRIMHAVVFGGGAAYYGQ